MIVVCLSTYLSFIIYQVFFFMSKKQYSKLVMCAKCTVFLSSLLLFSSSDHTCAAQTTILTPPVDATICLNSIAEFYCSTDGEYLVWRVNGTKANTFIELQIGDTGILSNGSGVWDTFLVPGIRKFENTNFTCLGGTDGVGFTTSNPAQLFVQGPPSPPSELTATPLNEASIKLTWSVPPGVLDEELISYLVEVRNESGGLIVLSETDGTEYTFSMDNQDPCDLYSFTVTPSCGTVEGENGSMKYAKESPLFTSSPDVYPYADQSDRIMYSIEFVIHVDPCPVRSVEYYSVSVQSIIATEQHYYYTFTHLRHQQQQHTPPPASNELRFSMALPANDKYLLNTTACNGTGCFQVYETSVSSFDVQNVSTTLDGDTLTVECWFIEGSRAKGCLVLITSSTGSSKGGPPFYQVIERGEERLVAEEQVRGLPAGGGGRFSVLVFDVEETGAPAPLPAALEGLYLESIPYSPGAVELEPDVLNATVWTELQDFHRIHICVSCELHEGSPALGCYVIIHPSTEHVSEVTVHALKGPSALDCFPVAQEGNYTVAVFDWEASGVIGDAGSVRMVGEAEFRFSASPPSEETPSQFISTWAVLCLVTLPVLFASCVLNVVAIVLCCIRFASNRKIPQEDNNILAYQMKENEAYAEVQVIRKPPRYQ